MEKIIAPNKIIVSEEKFHLRCVDCEKDFFGMTENEVIHNFSVHRNTQHKIKGELNLSKESDASNNQTRE